MDMAFNVDRNELQGIQRLAAAVLLQAIRITSYNVCYTKLLRSGDRICAAGCLFPLSQREEISRTLGTRHRAAIGITEET